MPKIAIKLLLFVSVCVPQLFVGIYLLESLRSQLKRLRIHPSVLVFLTSSDELPPVHVQHIYLKVLREEPWPAGVLSAASAANSTINGPTGVKMSGPYSWVPPVYWLQDTNQFGGAFGFLTEGKKMRIQANFNHSSTFC